MGVGSWLTVFSSQKKRPIITLLQAGPDYSSEGDSILILHILPQGFVRIRNFGFLANRRRATLLPLCFHLLGAAQQPQPEQNVSSTKDSSDLWHCPKCGGPMKVVERLTAAQIQLRSPPAVTVAA
jgi:hypothetical protein